MALVGNEVDEGVHLEVISLLYCNLEHLVWYIGCLGRLEALYDSILCVSGLTLLSLHY